jgi:hypothetical protein
MGIQLAALITSVSNKKDEAVRLNDEQKDSEREKEAGALNCFLSFYNSNSTAERR